MEDKMSDWFDEIEAVGRSKREFTPSGDDTAGDEYKSLWVAHPQGGGPFGGRDNALTAFVGMLRAKSLPFEGALAMALDWNNRYLSPPMEEHEVRTKVGSGWVRWLAGGIADATPEDATAPTPKRKLTFLNWAELTELAKRADDTEWIVPRAILRGGVHFITAPAGGGKSWAAVDLVRACATGEKWLDSIEAKPCKVLYVNEEMGAGQFWLRASRISGGNLANMYTLQQEQVKLDNPEHLAAILEFIKAEGIEVVVLDTLVRVHGYDENSNTEMARLYDKVRRINALGVAVVALHHHKKGKGADNAVSHEQMRGAGEIAAQADLIASIDQSEGVYRFRTTKNRHYGDDDWVSIDYRLVSDGAEGDIRIVQVSEGLAEYQGDVVTTNRILDSLSSSSIHPTVLSTRIGIPMNRLMPLVESLIDEGLVEVDTFGAISSRRSRGLGL